MRLKASRLIAARVSVSTGGCECCDRYLTDLSRCKMRCVSSVAVWWYGGLQVD